MTVEEAIKNLRNSVEILNMSIQALEQQAPKKPHKYIGFDGIERDGCPNCFEKEGINEILYTGQKYCSVCGCKIDRAKERDSD